MNHDMLPLSIKPMLATAAAQPFDSKDYLFELKWDGIRCLAFIEHGRVRLQSRHLVDITDHFPELAGLQSLPSGTVLDGELVVLIDGRPSLSGILQRAGLDNQERRRWLSQSMPAVFVIFDLLYLNYHSFTAEPFINRRAVLQELFHEANVPNVVLCQSIREQGVNLFAAAVSLQLEGVMAKYVHGSYLPGKRSRNWLKIKPPKVQCRQGTFTDGAQLAVSQGGLCRRFTF